MSYRSRLYNHRNAQAPELNSEKPFFSTQHEGNQKNNRSSFFQAKLAVNKPGDQYEQEADNVAHSVVNRNTSTPVTQQNKISSVQRLATTAEEEKVSTNDQRMNRDKEKPFQRKTEEPEKDKLKGIQKMDEPEKEKGKGIQKSDDPEKEKMKGVQKKDEPKKEEEDKKKTTAVQTKQDSAAGTASPQVSSKIEGSAGKGKALPKNTQREMSSSFGTDFSGVRIHDDSEAVAMNEELNAQAFTRGHDIYFNEGKFDPNSATGKFLLAHELTHVVQQEGLSEKRKVQKKDAPKKALIDLFGEKFPDSVDVIKKSGEALLLIKEASDAGVEFGGYSEDGPSKDAWPYTMGNKVYVPRAHKNDKITAVSDFLFELNNAIRSSGFKDLAKEAGKGSKGTLTAKAYAKKIVENEVEGMLRLGKVWIDMKNNKPKKDNWDKYDGMFYKAEYEAFKSGKKTKDDIVKDVLGRVYSEGVDKGKTAEQFYMDQYNSISGGK
ncbi:DUF4157 domain-containing protein [Chitinophagaceae bacterium 26-R-25]|nr:DUF4157 domain-containing protein [Chitinophagaceae bacterium 26-R-25]